MAQGKNCGPEQCGHCPREIIRRKSYVRVVVACFAAVFLCMCARPVNAQTTQELQQEILQMKQTYEQKITALEGRITTLEQANLAMAHVTDKNTVSVPDLEAEVSKQVTAKEEPKLSRGEKTAIEQTELANTPQYDEVQDSEKVVRELQQQVKQFEFRGYLRSGQGLNNEGGQMVAFQAPGAPAKYRLGNEPETYGELIFVNNWLNPNRDLDKAWMKTEVMVQGNTTQASNYASNDQFRLREAFVQVGNVLASNSGAQFWAGERYYRRQNIDINDFFILDMSGYGGGMENLNVKIGQVAVAYLGGARDDLITDNGVYPKSNLDARLYGVKTPVGELGFWYDYSFSKGGTVADGSTVPSTSGWAIGIGHTRTEWLVVTTGFRSNTGKGIRRTFQRDHTRRESAKRSHFPLYRERGDSAQRQVRRTAGVHLPVANGRQPCRCHQHVGFIWCATGVVLYRPSLTGV